MIHEIPKTLTPEFCLYESYSRRREVIENNIRECKGAIENSDVHPRSLINKSHSFDSREF